MKVKILIILLILIFIITSGFNLKQFKKDNKIVLVEDLNNDGNVEMISMLNSPNDKLKIYIIKNKVPILIESENNAKIDSDLNFGSTQYFVILDEKNNKNLIIISSLFRRVGNRGESNGNIILSYRYDGNKLIMNNYIYSDYKFINHNIEKKNDDDINPLGRYPILTAVINDEKNEILIYNGFYVYTLNSNLSIFKIIENSTFYHIIEQFKKVPGGYDFVIREANKMSYALWSTTYGQIGDYVEIIADRIESVSMDDKTDNFYVVATYKGKKYKNTFECIKKPIKTIKIKTEKIK